MICPSCGSLKLQKRGCVSNRNGERRQSYLCNSCGRRFVDTSFKHKFGPSTILYGDKYVITTIQNNVNINEEFYAALLTYCQVNNAGLIIIPTIYQKNLYDELEWAIDESKLFTSKASIRGMVDILSPNTNISPTTENPLAGLDVLSKGKSLIVPHNQLQMRSLPVQRNDHPLIMHTTGTISEPSYTKSKAGEKAEFNHSYSAVVVEIDEEIYHIRVLNADDNNGFYDIDKYYTKNSVSNLDRAEAIVTGDEHVFVKCPDVANATYYNKNSMVSVLKPKVIVRHDVLDCFTISHHHRKDKFLEYSKFITGKNKIEDELNQTVDFVNTTTPKDSYSIIISSNHHDHLKRWLNECDPDRQPWNAKIYHLISWAMLDYVDSYSTISSPDPFRLYVEMQNGNKIKFVGRNDNYKIKGIELSNHGDIGANGSRGSLNQYARFSDKVVIGHSHTPGINKGAYSVGCSTPKTLEYTNGPSSWMNTHCIIYPNGKRQLINVIKGRWRKSS